ncbi:MAG: class I SAM-dependent methyltransferase [Chloroflexia bacterium]|nr:class I SAM-dependent methyltransferase [Chloroflexia bacterium]
MTARPAHLTAENAAAFREQGVVDLYHLRLPYPREVFGILTGLTTGEPLSVLDVGAGTGELARPLAGRANRVDAVDISEAMVKKGRTMPGGNHPHLRWIVLSVETAELWPPYSLITAGDSMHWMDWEVVFPRFREILTPRGLVAIVHRDEPDPPWQEDLMQLIRHYSTMRNYQPFDLITELEQRGLFLVAGKHETAPVSTQQSVEDYVASFHSRSSLSRRRMPSADVAAFDHQLRELVEPWSSAGMLDLQTVASVVWGVP